MKKHFIHGFVNATVGAGLDDGQVAELWKTAMSTPEGVDMFKQLPDSSEAGSEDISPEEVELLQQVLHQIDPTETAVGTV